MSNKFKAKPTVIDDIKFASKKEARRYGDLKLLERAGEIKDLEVHPKFKLEVNGQPLMTPKGRQIRYEGDFRYREKNGKGWTPVIEDVKGYVPTSGPVYRLFALKAAIVESMTGTKVRIT